MRYERSRPGELVHLDVQRLAASPDGAAGKRTAKAQPAAAHKRARIGFGYVRSASITTPAWRSQKSCPSRRSHRRPRRHAEFTARTAHGKTGKTSASTGRCEPNGPTNRCSLPTMPAPRHLHHGSSTTHSTTSQRPWRPPTDQPPATNLMTGYTWPGAERRGL